MNEKIDIVLNKLRNGEMDVNSAIKEIEEIEYKATNEISYIKCAKKIKIYINAIDNSENGKSVKINLPALSLKFLKKLGTFGIKMAIKYADKDNSNINIKDFDKVKFVFDALSMLPPFEIVNIDSKDAKIHIYTC